MAKGHRFRTLLPYSKKFAHLMHCLILAIFASGAAVDRAEGSSEFLFVQPDASAPAPIQLRNPFSKDQLSELLRPFSARHQRWVLL